MHTHSHSPLTPFTVTFAGKQQSGLINVSVALDFFGLFDPSAASKGGGLRVLLICI